MWIVLPFALSTLGIVLIVIGVILVLFVIGGILGANARSRRQADTYAERVAAADQALEHARAGDKGWDRDTMEEVATAALAEARPGWGFDRLDLVLVDDRPGIEEDRAHFLAVGDEGEARVILARQGERWVAERVE
jgi:hypothetical protein